MTVAEAVSRDHLVRRVPVIDVYARVSRASDEISKSTGDQAAICKKLVVEAGYLVGQVHYDVGKGAWNPKRKRPGWDAVMVRLESGACDGIIVWELSRFARRHEDGLRLLRLAQDERTPRNVIDSEGEYDLTKPKQAKQFMAAINDAEFESAQIGARTRRGKAMKAAGVEGSKPATNTSSRAFGFELGNVVPRPEEAAELVAAARALVAGKKQEHIVEDLNARGVLTTRGNSWKSPSLRVALSRPANVGDVVHLGAVLHRGAHPGIMDRELYDQVMALYAGRKRGRPVTNLCAGFVLCERCTKAMHAKEMTSANHYLPYPDGTPRKVYVCPKRYGEGCHQMIDWRDLDAYVRDLALAIVADPGTVAAIEAQASAVDSELAPVEARIAELRVTRDALDENVGQLGIERWTKMTKPLDEQLNVLQARAAQLRASAPDRALVAQKASRATWEKRWELADVHGRREIVRQAFRGRRLIVSAGPRLQPAHERCRFDVELAG